jgi:hypothetical protein
VQKWGKLGSENRWSRGVSTHFLHCIPASPTNGEFITSQDRTPCLQPDMEGFIYSRYIFRNGFMCVYLGVGWEYGRLLAQSDHNVRNVNKEWRLKSKKGDSWEAIREGNWCGKAWHFYCFGGFLKKNMTYEHKVVYSLKRGTSV